MSVNQEFEETGSITSLCAEYLKNNFIDPEECERLGVKRGLRNADGTGLLAGLTNVCDVVGLSLIHILMIAVFIKGHSFVIILSNRL